MTQTTETSLKITTKGDLTSATCQNYLTLWKEELNNSTEMTSCTLDLKNSAMVDSEGLNLIIGVFKECQNKNISFKVEGARQEVKRLFSYLKITKFFEVN